MFSSKSQSELISRQPRRWWWLQSSGVWPVSGRSIPEPKQTQVVNKIFFKNTLNYKSNSLRMTTFCHVMSHVPNTLPHPLPHPHPGPMSEASLDTDRKQQTIQAAVTNSNTKYKQPECVWILTGLVYQLNLCCNIFNISMIQLYTMKMF